MKIRYHHLLCLPRFEGKGYSSDFCENLKRIIPEFEKGNYELTDSYDDVCKACPELINGVCKTQEKVSRYDIAVKSALAEGKTPLVSEICSDCEWYYICKDK